MEGEREQLSDLLGLGVGHLFDVRHDVRSYFSRLIRHLYCSSRSPNCVQADPNRTVLMTIRDCHLGEITQPAGSFTEVERAIARGLIDKINTFNLETTGIAEFHEMLSVEILRAMAS